MPTLAVACDDGVVRYFTVEEGLPGAQYRRSLGRVEGRALCLAWHPGGGTLFCGYSDATIRAWDAASGREIYRINAGTCHLPGIDFVMDCEYTRHLTRLGDAQAAAPLAAGVCVH